MNFFQIDHRRAYNCEIMLSKVKIPLHELMDYVLALDETTLDADQVEKLIKFCPTKEVMETLKFAVSFLSASWGGRATSRNEFMVDVHSTLIEFAFHFSLFIHIGLLLRYRSTTTGMFLIFKSMCKSMVTAVVTGNCYTFSNFKYFISFQCFFLENVVQEIETPFFATNATFDSGQVRQTVQYIFQCSGHNINGLLLMFF
ncbi:putative formin, FH2 domain-containing protein [Helianthus debilis subsp. tardiflorus]